MYVCELGLCACVNVITFDWHCVCVCVCVCVCNISFDYTFETGEDETFGDKLRSVLAQMEFKYIIRSWDSKGVPFQTYMYVPEIHPILSKEFHEREDEGHVFKVYNYYYENTWHTM